MNPDHKKYMHLPGFTYTNYNLGTGMRTPDTEYKTKKNIHTPSLTNTDNILEKGIYKLQKIETGSDVWSLQYDDEKIVAGLRNGDIKINNKLTLKLDHVIKAYFNTVRCLQKIRIYY